MTTSSELLATFGLRMAPFSKEIDDADLWLPESKAALVADIEEALAERQAELVHLRRAGDELIGEIDTLRVRANALERAYHPSLAITADGRPRIVSAEFFPIGSADATLATES